MAKSPHELKAELMTDAAEAQRANGAIPDTRADDAFWTEILSTMEQAGQLEQKPKAPAKKRAPAELRAKTISALREQGCEILSPAELAAINGRRRAQAKRRAKASSREKAEAFMVRRRLRLLRCFPEWRARVWQAWEDGRRLADLNPEQPIWKLQAFMLLQVIEASNATFGDWQALRLRKTQGLPTGRIAAKNTAEG